MDTTICKKIITEKIWDVSECEVRQKLFDYVRDIPYGDINSRDPQDVYEQNKWTCSGKHALLRELFRYLWYEVKDVLMLHRFSEMTVVFPDHIKEILNRSDIIDPTNFVRVKIDWSRCDISLTRDVPTEKLWFIVNKDRDGITSMQIAAVAGGEIFEVEDAVSRKKELISKLPTQVQQDRKLFLKEVTRWLDWMRESWEV